MTDKYFDRPEQVMFIQIKDGGDKIMESTGIAYHDYVICACCGGVIPLEDVDGLYPLKYWVDFCNSIDGHGLTEYNEWKDKHYPDLLLM